MSRSTINPTVRWNFVGEESSAVCAVFHYGITLTWSGDDFPLRKRYDLWLRFMSKGPEADDIESAAWLTVKGPLDEDVHVGRGCEAWSPESAIAETLFEQNVRPEDLPAYLLMHASRFFQVWYKEQAKRKEEF